MTLRSLLGILCLLLLSSWAPRAPLAGPPRAGTPSEHSGGTPAASAPTNPAVPSPAVPRPCFVPPHPKKLGGKPKVEAPARVLEGLPPDLSVLGGSAFGYHDTHLRDDGPHTVADLAALDPVTRNALVLLVDFDDQEMGTAFAAEREDSIQIYFNRVMTHLNQMYEQMSDGLLSIEWELTPVYRVPQTMAYYGLDDSIATREAALCRDAVTVMDEDYDFSRYDTFLLFHAGAGQEADIDDDGRKQIWSVFFRGIDFQYWLIDPRDDCEPFVYSEQCDGLRTNDTDPQTNLPFRVPHMVLLPESESQDGYAFGMQGVVAHEFGHSFGLPDLYDTTAPEDFIFADSQGIGAFGLMGAGIWNDNGFFPAEFCIWSRFYVGWTRPRVVRPDELGGETLESLEAVQHDRRGGAIRIPLGGDEYFLIENRLRDYNGNGILDFDDANENGVFDFWTDSYANAEFDWHLPRELQVTVPGQDGSGLLVWHIDESILREYLLYNLVNAEALHKGVDLEEADGIQDLDKLEFSFEAFGDSRDAFWAPYATEFTPLSEPNTDGYNGAHTGIWITDVSGPGSTMTFRLRFTSPDGPAPGDFRPGWPRDLPGRGLDYQPVGGDLDGDGRPEIIVAAADALGNGGLVVLDGDGESFFNPGSGPEIMQRGTLRSDPVLANLDGQTDPLPELLWVSADTLYARKGNGSYLGSDGLVSAGPVPYYVFDRDPGRVLLSVEHVEPAGNSRQCGDTPLGERRPEILVAVPSSTDTGMVDILAIAPPEPAAAATHTRVLASVPGVSATHHTLADLDNVDGGLREIVSSVRTETGGYIAVTLYDILNDACRFSDVRTIAFSLDDTVSFTAPVAGDVDRDGIEEILAGDSRGYLHLIRPRILTAGGQAKIVGVPGEGGPIEPASFVIDNTKFEEYPGWPVYVGALADDGLSLADVDDDGLLEVLAFGPVNTLHVLNYNGTAVLTLPVAVDGEDRFTLPFLSPLVLDVAGDPEPELVLPLPDGQVRGHTRGGRPLDGWSYLGGGGQGLYPVILDLDGDGALELITTEDVTVAVPDTTDVTQGDESPGIPRVGRVIVRSLGTGTGQGPWPVFRHDAARSGRAPGPATEPGDGFPGLMSQTFVMPNPVLRREDTGFHYQVRSDVQRVKVQVFAADGRLVRTLDGPVDVHTDNLLRWNLTNENGNGVASGIYVARIQAEAGTSVEIRTVTFVVIR